MTESGYGGRCKTMGKKRRRRKGGYAPGEGRVAKGETKNFKKNTRGVETLGGDQKTGCQGWGKSGNSLEKKLNVGGTKIIVGSWKKW